MLRLVINAGKWVISTFSQLVPHKRGRALVLDSILGPAERFKDMPTTTPLGPPPSI